MASGEASGPHPTDTLAVVVTAARQLPGQVLHLSLGAANGLPLPGFEPGAHVDLHLGPGLVRQYSLCHAPDTPGDYQLGVLLSPGSRGGSAAVHRLARPGATLRISPPRNLFALRPDTRRAVLLAGGIGITPLLAMAHWLHHRALPFRLHHAVRRADQAALAELLPGLPFAGRLHQHADNGPAGQRLDIASALGAPEAGCHAYLCGPAGFMDQVARQALALGWPQDHLHREHFQPPEPVASTGDKAFVVEARRSGLRLVVPPGSSMAQALKQAGVNVWTSCEQGVCGTCLTPLLAGQADHRDRYQTTEEKQAQCQVALCCSRACSDTLVLDI